MWELYDKLIEPVPEDVYVEEVICGKTWTAVLSSEGCIGLAMTTPVETLPRSGESAVGMSLRAAAEKVKSWNFIEAGIGMAAINAFYNSPERMRRYKTRQGDSRFCTYDLPIEGRKMCMIGALRYPPELFKDTERLVVLERNLVEGTYPDSACEYFVPESELVLITGSAFINKTMPRLLQLVIHAHRTGLCCTSQRKLHGHDRQAQQQQAADIDQNKAAAAVLTGHPRELPYVTASDGTSCAEKDET